jgi:hypothetical protein
LTRRPHFQEIVKSEHLNSEDHFEDRGAAAPKILLTDTNRWPAAARLAIALSRRGCNVAALCPMPGHPVQKASVVQRTFHYSGFDPLTSLKTAIAAFEPDVVVPCCDRGVQHLHELHAHSRAQGPTGKPVLDLIECSLGSPENFAIVSARYALLKIALEEGILVPPTIELRDVDDLKSWRAEADLPWVIKADGTWGGRGVRVAYSGAEAEQRFFELTEPAGILELIKRLLLSRDRGWVLFDWKRSQPAVIAQSLIAGRPANCAVVCWQGKVLAGIGVEVVSAQGPKGPATVVRVVESPDMMRAAERIARRLRLSGFFGLDFMIEDGTGATYLIEMNPRCTPLCPLTLGKGRDLAGALWGQLAGQPPSEKPPVTEKAMIAYFPQAWNGTSELLDASYHDIPEGEPELIQELLHPWSERSLLGRIFDRTRRMWTSQPTSGAFVFSGAMNSFESVPARPVSEAVATDPVVGLEGLD